MGYEAQNVPKDTGLLTLVAMQITPYIGALFTGFLGIECLQRMSLEFL